MNNREAREILAAEIATFRPKSYAELQAFINAEPNCCEQIGRTGAEYQIEIQVYWDDKPGGDIRVSGGIDDGGWRAFLPLTDSFIKRSDNTFVGE